MTDGPVSKERWREVACQLADTLEELFGYAAAADAAHNTDDVKRALAEFMALADEDDPPEKHDTPE